MLEIKNINKYFNRHKKNEVHVIDNTSLSLDRTGLIAILGQSGCGKTTLLNVIGGLDKVNKGSIYINGKKISSKFSYKVDKIRNLNVGYIFQDYKLVDNLSVFDNVALVLTMIGIKDKDEIKKRVEYVLDKVGMLRYKKRPAGMLSGGEKQRVGIARAIVKDPNIILADEPTGNLDSKNSLEIMKIIKAISKDKLVILVTHEQNLAKFYASRIIELTDGKVTNDYLNQNENELDYRIDNNFYLQDFKEKISLSKDSNKINIYHNDDEKLDIDIVIKNNNIYIRSNNKYNPLVVDDSSNIEFINDTYKKISQKDIDKYKFDFKDIINNNYKLKYTSIFNPITLLINGFKKVFDYSFIKKILLIGFFLSGMFIMYSVSSIVSNYNIKDEDFVTINKDYLLIDSKNIKVADFLSYENKDNINYILPGNSIVNFNVKYNDYYQTSRISDTLAGSLASIDMINENDLIYGTMPSNDYELVVDKFTIKKMFDDTGYAKMAGIFDISDMVGRMVQLNNMNSFKIVGICDKKSPSIYANNKMFINILQGSVNNSSREDVDISEISSDIVDYSLYQDKIVLKEGRYPYNDYEVIVNITNKEDMKLNKTISTKINNTPLTVVGYYTSKEDINYYFVNNNMIKYSLINTANNIVINTSNKEITLQEFRNLNLNINDSYEYSRDNYIKLRKESCKSSLIAAIIILVISLIEMYLMIRSSFLSRIKEIGIYRAIGVKKKDIYKMFLGEIFAITTIGSIPGLIFMTYILITLSKIKMLASLFYINLPVVVISIISVYLFNIIIGLIPIFNVVRKTPAQILARYDI